MKHMCLAAALLLIGCSSGSAPRTPPEKYYQLSWCAEHGGQAEVVLPDGTRCDCLTATHAIEFDFAKKWAEAIGQSLHYAALTGRRAGIVLIGTTAADNASADHLANTIAGNGLKIDLLQRLTATKLQQKP